MRKHSINDGGAHKEKDILAAWSSSFARTILWPFSSSLRTDGNYTPDPVSRNLGLFIGFGLSSGFQTQIKPIKQEQPLEWFVGKRDHAVALQTFNHGIHRR